MIFLFIRGQLENHVCRKPEIYRKLVLSIAGMLCLWTGVMEVMRQSGLADKLSLLLSPVLRRLFPQAARDRAAMDAISANVSANLLGLGSAATPLGLGAARRAGPAGPEPEPKPQPAAPPPAALCADLTGFLAAAWAVRVCFG